jgi:hypothetical protein
MNSTTVFTSIETITRDIDGSDQYIWVFDCFTMANTVVQPLLRQLADILRPSLANDRIRNTVRVWD